MRRHFCDSDRACLSIWTGTMLGTLTNSPFAQWNLMDGPSGALASHTYRSLRFRASKNKTLLQPCSTANTFVFTVQYTYKFVTMRMLSDTFMSATSLMTPLSVLVSSLESRLQWGNSCAKSIIRWRDLHGVCMV